jgi:hypothetical protein
MYSLDTPENMGQEKIVLTQKGNNAKKRNKQKKIMQGKAATIVSYLLQIIYNNSSSPNIDGNLKLSSDDVMKPHNCLTQ